MKKLNVILLSILLIPLALSVEVKEEIYNGMSTHPSFFCPDSIRCEMYKVVDGMNRNVTPPLLVKTCEPSTNCDYVNDIGASLGFRLLPGDVCLASAVFKGYKILDVDYVTTTTTTTTITTTTQPETYQKICVQTFRGWCIRWERVYDTTTTIAETTTTLPEITSTTTIPTTTTLHEITTTTIPECSPLESSCSLDSDCCSGNCKIIKTCKNPTIHGFCLFPKILRICA